MSWESQAGNWITWARKPGHDAYWHYRGSFLGVDVAPTMVEAAREADPDGTYLVADAGALPLGDESFDLVVAYNSLMDVGEMPGMVREAARVLEPGGGSASA